MKTSFKTFICAFVLFIFHSALQAQNTNGAENFRNDKKMSIKIGGGLFQPFLSETGVGYANASYDPNTGPGFSYFASFDYAITKNISIGVGYNGSFAGAEFIRNAVVDGQTINGYLEAGAVTNTHLLLNVTYTVSGEGIRPFATLGLGYLIQQVELGDVPLALTNNVETEIFPDFKSSGFGILPELGVQYYNFSLSAAYGISFEELTGEKNPDGFVSAGSLTSQALQINIGYRIYLF